jgi:hypothetical protein
LTLKVQAVRKTSNTSNMSAVGLASPGEQNAQTPGNAVYSRNRHKYCLAHFAILPW